MRHFPVLEHCDHHDWAFYFHVRVARHAPNFLNLCFPELDAQDSASLVLNEVIEEAGGRFGAAVVCTKLTAAAAIALTSNLKAIAIV